MDLPGFGKSSTVLDGDYTISSQVRRLKSFASALDLESFHMGGVSMGGYIAGIYASEYPNDLKSLLLIAPLGVNSAKPSLFDQKINAMNLDVSIYGVRLPTSSIITYEPPFGFEDIGRNESTTF